MSDADRNRERLIATYRRKAKHYELTSRLYPVPFYPLEAQRLRAVRALRLRPGDTVVDIACGTGQNFALVEAAIGPAGRVVAVDMTDAMLAQAQRRADAHGWSNVTLVHADAAAFEFPPDVAAVLSTYALSQVPDCAAVIAHGAAALAPRGGRLVVLDLKLPVATPRWVARGGTSILRRFAAIDDWVARRPWEAIRTAMAEGLADVSWTELCFGTAFLASGSGAPHAAPRS